MSEMKNGLNGYASREVIEELRNQYKPGTVVVLDKMIDIQAPEIGSRGEVIDMDDIGTVHVSWLTGGTLGVAYGEDEIHLADPHETALYRIAKESAKQKMNPDSPCFCPRCGEPMGGISRHARSRRADIIICDECGVKESIEDAVAAGVMKGSDPLPIEEWAVAKGAYHIYAEEDENGWKVSVPKVGAVSHCEKPEDIVPTGVKLKDGELISKPSTVTYEIYQLKPDISNHGIAFMSLEYLKEKGIKVEPERYEKVYEGCVDDEPDILDNLYLKFNTSLPADFKGHSLSVSDVVVIDAAGKRTAYYVDKIGLSEITGFLK